MENLLQETHPKGEHDLANLLNDDGVSVDTFDGKVQIEWDPQAPVTMMGQLAFFINFLKTTGLFDAWVEDCPLTYNSNNAHDKRDILGTFFLSILAGHTRYSHITILRNDNVNPALLGMNKVVSEDAARRALLKLEPDQATHWCQQHLQKCYLPLLDIPWILDVDTTVKPLYGKQEGAEVGYNPHKPGRPSHSYHTYFIANIRLILDVELQDGLSTAGCYSAKRLWELLDGLPANKLPQFIRGDIGYGNEGIMAAAETRKLGYLFKLKCTTKVKQLIACMMQTNDWTNAGQGFEGVEGTLRLSGWSEERRVIVLRRKLPQENIGILSKQPSGQLCFDFAEIASSFAAYEYAVLVTNLESTIIELAQHYRDRADCENNFDEMKNQWGWAGYTTQDLHRCQITARMIALIYNWWTLFVRLANPDQHLEAITSRPLLLHSVGKQSNHAGQKKLTITNAHAKAKTVTIVLSAIANFLKVIKQNAEQLSKTDILTYVLRVAFRRYLRTNVHEPPLLLANC